MFLPFVGITVSSRESADFRNGIAKICATKVSAGVSTGIGDHEEKYEGTKDADVIYTDIWVSMGEDESLYKPRVEMLSPYKVTQEMMSKTGKDSTLFMHCLPSFHDFETTVAKTKHDEGIDIREVEDEVFRSKNSVVLMKLKTECIQLKQLW